MSGRRLGVIITSYAISGILISGVAKYGFYGASPQPTLEIKTEQERQASDLEKEIWKDIAKDLLTIYSIMATFANGTYNLLKKDNEPSK